MVKIAGVRFKKSGRIYYFDPMDIDIKKGDDVIVETSRGLEYGNVVIDIREIDEEEIVAPLKPVVKVATEEDKKKYLESKERAAEAMQKCEQKIKEHVLDMHLIDAEYTFDDKKIIFYFTAEGRIDFRELVKDLAQIFRMRIELRQIGVRDEAKLTGGLGACGRELCCSTFLGDFQPVSIKMAKEQSLSLNPAKISGVCGRLMCCLKYEQETYEEILSRMPVVGTKVKTPDRGYGTVVGASTLLELVKVKVKSLDDDSEEIVPFRANELEFEKTALEEASKINLSEIVKTEGIEDEEAKFLKKIIKEE